MAPGSQGRKCRHSGIYLLGDNPHRNVTQSHLQWLKFVKNIGTILQLGLRRRKFAGRHGIVETGAGVGPVAERLVGRLPQRQREITVRPARPNAAPAGSRISKSPSMRMGPLFKTITLVGITGMVARALFGAPSWVKELQTRGLRNESQSHFRTPRANGFPPPLTVYRSVHMNDSITDS
jgi:hypothetical protein